jgi:HlyD family secretion protein
MTANKSFRWWKWLLAVLILGAAGGGYYWHKTRTTQSAVDYKTAILSRGDITQSVTANGQLTPVISVQVGSQISGIIKGIKVDFNSQVTSNQVIAQIDPSTYEQSIAQAQADLANAMASLEYTQLNYKRSSELRKSELISVSENEKALVDLHQAEAVVKMREASVNKAKVDLERTTIYAPIDGVVISRNIDVGQTVAASFNTPTLFLIANDLRNMRIEAMVSEADVGGLEVGQKVNFTVDAFVNRQFQGKITQVRFAPITNQNVVSYVSIVEVNNDDLKLRPGMTANATIVTAERLNVLRVPNAALRFRPTNSVAAKTATNTADKAGGNLATNQAPIATSGPYAGMPTPPWATEGRRPTPEERDKWEATLTPEQREQSRQMRERMRQRMSEGGGGGGGMGGGGPGAGSRLPRSTPEGPATRTLYVLEKNSANGKEETVLKPVTVKTGIADASYTEILEGLKEGDVVVTGVNLPVAAAAAVRPGGSSPFGGPGGFRPR